MKILPIIERLSDKVIRNTFIQIFGETWPTIIISMVILISMRLIYIIKNKEELIIYRELMMLIFIIYVVCLFYVVTFQDVSWSTSNYVPFHEITRYEFGSRLFIKNVVGNIILFIPYGFFVTYYLKFKKPYPVIILSVLVSLTIETTQLLIGRVFDIDDILLNIVGSTIGFVICYSLYKFNDHLPNILKKPIVYNIILLLILGIFMAYLTGFIKIGV